MDKWNEIRDFLATELTALGRDCCVSGSFLTRLPFPSVKGAGKKGSLGAASRAFPLVGAVIGVIAGLSLMAGASLNLHPLACALIALAVAALVTGAPGTVVTLSRLRNLLIAPTTAPPTTAPRTTRATRATSNE